MNLSFLPGRVGKMGLAGSSGPKWASNDSMAHVAGLPIEQQAEYVDPVTRSMTRKPGWVENQIALQRQQGLDVDTPSTERWNIASIGNGAYTALHAPRTEDREWYRRVLESGCKAILSGRVRSVH